MSAFPAQSISSFIVDDHVAFAELDIPTVDLIIDFWSVSAPWPYHHTLADNMDHISSTSLEITGRTVFQFTYEWCYLNQTTIPSNAPLQWYWIVGIIIVAGAALYGFYFILRRIIIVKRYSAMK